MIGIALSVVVTFAYGYALVGPANRGYSPWAWAFMATFLKFGLLLCVILSLVLGGAVQGQPVAPLSTVLAAIAYSGGVALAAGLGAGLRSHRDGR